MYNIGYDAIKEDVIMMLKYHKIPCWSGVPEGGRKAMVNMDGLRLDWENVTDTNGNVTMWTVGAFDALGLVEFSYSKVSEKAALRGLKRKLQNAKGPIFKIAK